VAAFIAGLNRLAQTTGLTVVGTNTSPFALRIIEAKGTITRSAVNPGRTVDAAHLIDRVWVDGASYRRHSDPQWATSVWGEQQNRRAGNEQLPGPGPQRLGYTDDELQAFATRDGGSADRKPTDLVG
jgi:hypothetical protein